MGLRSGTKGKDAFVVVSYDFEYITEEGKEVTIALILSRGFDKTASLGVDERGRSTAASVQNQWRLVAGELCF